MMFMQSKLAPIFTQSNFSESNSGSLKDDKGRRHTTPFPRRIRSKSESYSVFVQSSLTEQCQNGELFRSRERLLRTQRHPKPSVLCKFTKEQILVLFTLALAEFISFCSMSVMAPFFPKEAARKGMSTTVSGFVFSFYALVVFATSPFFGKILPSVGAKFLFMSGMFLAGGCNILFGLLPYIQNYGAFTFFCFTIRTLEAVGASAYSTASFVFVVEVFPENISAVLGILETAMGLGMSAGPAIGGILYSDNFPHFHESLNILTHVKEFGAKRFGGFGLPFYALGSLMILLIPTNWKMIPSVTGSGKSTQHASFGKLYRIPSVIVISAVIVVASNTWAFLDPTLEPHLSHAYSGLTSYHIGLIFLLFAALYGIFSPLWGWTADRLDNHWSMMVIGLLLSAVGLLLLGPSPLLEREPSLWLDITGLCIIGMSVALTLMPTFKAILKCAEFRSGRPNVNEWGYRAGPTPKAVNKSISIDFIINLDHGLKRELSTYSIVAGAWSCMYSLGDMTGPAIGGVISEHFGFPVCTTVMASLSGATALMATLFFTSRCSQSDIYEEEEENQMPLLKGSGADYGGITEAY